MIYSPRFPLSYHGLVTPSNANPSYSSSLNCLAFAYATPASHPGVLPPSLSIPHRTSTLASTLSALLSCSDILLLQEVDHFDTLYLPLLTANHWAHTTAMRGNEPSRDRLLTCYNPAIFALVATEVIDLDDLSASVNVTQSRRYKRFNSALLTHLRHIATNEHLVVTNLHLYWSPAFEDVKLGQSMYLAARTHSYIDSLALPPDTVRVIIGGDFNTLPNTGVHDFFTRGSTSMASICARLRALPSDFKVHPKFHGDVNCNKFVRWLRMLGIDVGLETADDERVRVAGSGTVPLFAAARAENRVLLTTSCRLMERKDCPTNVFFVDTKTTDAAAASLVKLLAWYVRERSERTYK